jgi:hypothetical protein
MADRIEIPVQHAISESPDEYRAAAKIVVEASHPAENDVAEAAEGFTTIRFEAADHSSVREEACENVA